MASSSPLIFLKTFLNKIKKNKKLPQVISETEKMFVFFNRNVRYRSRSMKVLCLDGISKQKRKRSENFIKREINLLKTLITTVFVFVIFWTPYALVVLVDSDGVDFRLKKVIS